MRQRLKGASVASYYPPRIGTISQLRSLYPEHELLDEDEEDWLEHLNVARSRGKAVPKKKRTAAGMFCGERRWLELDADIPQNRRSSTRGSRRPHHEISVTKDTVHLLYERAWNGILSGVANAGIVQTPKYKTTSTFHLYPSLWSCTDLQLTLQPYLSLPLYYPPFVLKLIIPRYPRTQMLS